MMNALWISLAIVGLVLIAGAVAFLVWLRHTLLSGIAVVDVNEVDPALKQTIERLELDYAVAEELGYDGNILLGIESQLNAAKLAAAAAINPNASSIYIVSVPAMPEDVSIPLTTSDLNPLPSLFSIASIPNVQLVRVK
jgi:hypothetical protein